MVISECVSFFVASEAHSSCCGGLGGSFALKEALDDSAARDMRFEACRISGLE